MSTLSIFLILEILRTLKPEYVRIPTINQLNLQYYKCLKILRTHYLPKVVCERRGLTFWVFLDLCGEWWIGQIIDEKRLFKKMEGESWEEGTGVVESEEDLYPSLGMIKVIKV